MQNQPIAIRFPEEVYQQIIRVSETYGLSKAQIIRSAFSMWINEFEAASESDRPALLLPKMANTDSE